MRIKPSDTLHLTAARVCVCVCGETRGGGRRGRESDKPAEIIGGK